MTRRVLSGFIVMAVVGGPAVTSALPLGLLRDVLTQRYPLSRIEVQSKPHEGAVIERGAVLSLEADGVSANTLRIIQTNTKSPRFHVRDYAEVEITDGGAIRAGAGQLRLPKGTRLVVLDLKAEPDRIRLFTHTADPIVVGGKPVYGCTEFVFRFHGTPLTARDVAQVEGVIERWLPFAG